MNIFRKNISEELETKISSYEVLISDFEVQLNVQALQIKDLTESIQDLIDNLKTKETVLGETEQLLEEKEEVIVEQADQIVKQEELIQEVIDNNITVDKQAAIKAAIILGEMGAPVVETIDAPEEVDILSQMKKLKGKDLVEFYAKHKEQISKL